MIAAGIEIPAWMILWLHTREFFWLYLLPVAAGFIVVCLYMLHMRIMQSTMMRGDHPIGVFLTGSISTMASLFGWRVMLRTWQLIPLYALGVGFAYAMNSRIYGVRLRRLGCLRVPRIIWRGNIAAVAELQKEMALVHSHGPK